MKVFIVKITDRQRYKEVVSVHSNADSADQTIYNYVEEHWSSQELGSIEAYNELQAMHTFFKELKDRYSHDVYFEELQGGVEENDPDIIELTPREITVTRAAMYVTSYADVAVESGLEKGEVMSTMYSVREKLED